MTNYVHTKFLRWLLQENLEKLDRNHILDFLEHGSIYQAWYGGHFQTLEVRLQYDWKDEHYSADILYFDYESGKSPIQMMEDFLIRLWGTEIALDCISMIQEDLFPRRNEFTNRMPRILDGIL